MEALKNALTEFSDIARYAVIEINISNPAKTHVSGLFFFVEPHDAKQGLMELQEKNADFAGFFLTYMVPLSDSYLVPHIPGFQRAHDLCDCGKPALVGGFYCGDASCDPFAG